MVIDKNDIVKLAVDAYKGKVAGNYSINDSMDVLREALIDANNGSTKLDIKAIRDGKCAGLFAIIEQIIPKTVIEGLQGDEFFMNFVEYVNTALGNKNEFWVEDNTFYVVDEIADGTQALRRQRIGGKTPVTIPTVKMGVKFYEELDLVLAGRIDLNDFINRVGVSVRRKIYDKIYTAFTGITATTIGATYFPIAGSYDENNLLDLIAHVESATDKPVTLVGTKKAVRKLATAIISDSAKEDLYNIGYYGKFYGTPIITVAQRHKVGTTEFLFDDSVIYVIPTGIKPIKFVTEGEDLILPGEATKNQDLTIEYLYYTKNGVGVIATEAFGIYDMT